MSKSRYNTPEEAEAAFYHSFEHRDPKAMMVVWDEADDVVCVHPFGTRLEGFDAVKDGWSGLLTGEQRLSFRVESSRQFVGDGLAVHAVLEYIRIQGQDTDHTPIVATNAYRLTDDGWRMVLHHASPQPRPEASPAKQQDEEEDAQRTIH